MEKEVELRVKDEKDSDSSLYGVLVVAKLREGNQITHKRSFTFKNELYGLFRIQRYVAALKELDCIKPETHYIEVKPTLRHKTPRWLLQRLRQVIVVKDAPNEDSGWALMDLTVEALLAVVIFVFIAWWVWKWIDEK